MPAIKLGEKLDGRYELLELIGEGGMANVYKAQDLLVDRLVAVKILKEECMGSEELVRRFKNESRAISVLNHPNIVKVYDISISDKMQYIVMEYIDGITLKEYIEQRGEPLTYKESIHFAAQVLQALQHAHDKGIVHRDIKPQNIMIAEDGSLKVMDFGIARLSRSESHTATDQAIGSVHYISPEQAQGDATDLRADIYSTGIMLYEMLTGTLPFDGENAVAIALKHISDEPRSLRQVNPAVPEGLADITMKAMAKEPRRRYQSALEMQRDLEEFKRNPSIKFEYDYLPSAEPTRYLDKMAKPTLKQPPSKKSSAKQTPSKRGWLVPVCIGITLAVVLVCAILIVNIFQNSGTPLFGTVENIEFPNFVGQNVDDVLALMENPPYNHIPKPITVIEDGEATDNGRIILSQIPTPKTIKANQRGIVFHVSVPTTEVPVPDVSGMTRAEASSALTKVGLMPYFKITVDSGGTKGRVVKTDPAIGTPKTNRNGENMVTVYIAGERIGEKVKVPKLVGLPSATEASAALAKQNLELLSIYKEEYSSEPAGTVIAQLPEPDTEVFEYTSVRITISKGEEPPPAPAMVAVPSVEGKSAGDAASILAQAGLGFGAPEEYKAYSDSVPEGYVINQGIAPGTEVAPGTQVDVSLSKGKAPAAAPPVEQPVSTAPVTSTPAVTG